MKFWDSSAIVPLLVREASSAEMRSLYRADTDMLVWWSTRVECRSALARERRMKRLTTRAFDTAIERLTWLADRWIEIEPSDAIRSTAERLIDAHDLRAADALQLGAAIAIKPLIDFVVLDRRLALAASAERLDVLPETAP